MGCVFIASFPAFIEGWDLLFLLQDKWQQLSCFRRSKCCLRCYVSVCFVIKNHLQEINRCLIAFQLRLSWRSIKPQLHANQCLVEVYSSSFSYMVLQLAGVVVFVDVSVKPLLGKSSGAEMTLFCNKISQRPSLHFRIVCRLWSEEIMIVR